MARHNRALGPVPTVPKGPQIVLTPEMSAVTEAAKQAQLPAPRRLASDEFIHSGTGEVLSILPKFEAPKAPEKALELDMWEAIRRRGEAREKEKSGEAATLPDLEKQLNARYGNR